MKNYLLLLITLFWIHVDTSEAQIADPLEKYYSSVQYRSIGPYRGGRSCAVTGVPGKPNLYYFGATGGGVWRTKDGGRSWENISDGYFGGSIGAVTVAESDHNVIYVGGGEKTVRGNVSYGYGMWKSIDAGKSWEQIGLKESRHIGRVRIHPRDPDIVYVAAMGNLYAPHPQRGVFKSTDGGKNWKKTLFINDDVGVVDLIIDPNNPRVLYASSWNIRRTPYSLSSGGEGSGLWKSTDAGESWTEITQNKGLPKGVWGISGVTVSPQNSNRIWAIIENENGGVYRSDDAGITWKKVNESRALRQRAWYYTRIYADTKDIDKVYVVNVRYHRSNDGGNTFEPYSAPHGDHHDLWIAPEDADRMIIADDGGAQISFDGGGTWSTYHNQPTAQFYRVTTDNSFPYRIYVAQQDNSTLRIRHRTNGSIISTSDWEPTAGGESAHIAPDPKNNDIVYGGSYGGYLTRFDHDLDMERAINVYPDDPMGHGAEGMKYRFQWNFPIFFSPHDPKKLYAASNHLHVTTDEGQSWQIISPDLTRNDPDKLKSSGGPITQDNTGVEYYCTIFAVAESKLEKGLIWAGTDDGRVHITRSGGDDWTEVTPTGAPHWIMWNSVEPDPRDPASCYLAGTLYKSGDFKPYLYKTSNYGQSWTKITNGISNDHFTRVLRTDPQVDDILYAGTETGMYITYNDGEQWYPFQLNLPIVPITDLAVKDNNLIVATQGRSIWIIDDLSVIHQAQNLDRDTDAHLYKPIDAYRYGRGQSKKVKSVGTNHPSGVMIHYFLKNYDEKQDTITLEFLEKDGKSIRTYSNHSDEEKTQLKDIKEGSNFFNWDMMYPEAKDFEGMILWWGSLNGVKAIPGDYQVRLKVNDRTLSEGFSILGDPRLEMTTADYNTIKVFINKINDKITEAHQAIIEIRQMNSQLDTYKNLLSDHPAVTDEIARIDSTLQHIENELYQTKNRSRQDPLNFPIKLTNKLAHLNSLQQIGDYPPTDQAILVKDVLTAQIDEQLEKYYSIKAEEIPKLNEMIRAQNVDYIMIKKDE